MGFFLIRFYQWYETPKDCTTHRKQLQPRYTVCFPSLLTFLITIAFLGSSLLFCTLSLSFWFMRLKSRGNQDLICEGYGNHPWKQAIWGLSGTQTPCQSKWLASWRGACRLPCCLVAGMDVISNMIWINLVDIHSCTKTTKKWSIWISAVSIFFGEVCRSSPHPCVCS